MAASVRPEPVEGPFFYQGRKGLRQAQPERVICACLSQPIQRRFQPLGFGSLFSSGGFLGLCLWRCWQH